MISVLVADSQRMFAESLRVALNLSSDLEVLDKQPESGLEAVEAVAETKPDVAILDYWMKGMRGPAATRFIRKKAPDSRVMLLTWHHSPLERREAIAAGAVAVVAKHAEISELGDAVRKSQDFWPAGSGRREDSDPSADPWEALITLTPREIQILGLLGTVGRVQDIAAQLSLSQGTVRNRIQSILSKTGARTKLEAVMMGRRFGLI